jgi:hypothetical protein
MSRVVPDPFRLVENAQVSSPSRDRYNSKSSTPKQQNVTTRGNSFFASHSTTVDTATSHASDCGYPKTPVEMHGKANVSTPFSPAKLNDSQ